jgi:hypothetical protein
MFQKVKRLVVLGLGSFSQSANAVHQLALLLQLIETYLSFHPVFIEIYDPVMSENDQTLCSQLGFRVLTENKQGRHAPHKTNYCDDDEEEEAVLYYMPHCPYRLYCNVLWDHWPRIQQVVILGNR